MDAFHHLLKRFFFCIIGPDGIRDHQATVLDPNTYVGIGTMSPEGTSDLNYLWRPSRVDSILSCILDLLVLQHCKYSMQRKQS